MSAELINQLNRIFHPRTVAIIGASAAERKFGRVFLESFIKAGFKDIYPVNPREREILGLKTYPSVTQVPVEVDYAVIVTPASAVLQAVSDCAEKGVAGATIYSSGFREKGREGAEMEKKVVEAARRGGTRLVGPNCLGIYCPASHLTLSGVLPMISGSIGIISNSGSLTFGISRMVLNRGLAVSKAVSCGNEADLSAADFLEYYGQDPETKVIVSYMEGMKDGPRFMRLAREIAQTKPIIIWKAGITERGARAAASHTGALAGSGEVWKGVFRQSGVTQVRSAEELIDCLVTLSMSPSPSGRGVVIISSPGGPAVAASDALIENGLTLAELSQETKNRIAEIIPTVGTSIDNPLDIGQAAMFESSYYTEAIKVAADEANVNMILSIGGSPGVTANALAEVKNRTGKPGVVTTSVSPDTTTDEFKSFTEAGVPFITDPRRAARALSALAERADFLRRTAGKNSPVYARSAPHETIARARDQGRDTLSEYDSKRLLATYGIPVTREELVTDKREALAAAKRIGYPIGLKACGAHILHKTELGLVELNLKDAKEVEVAFDLLGERAEGLFPDGILVQEMIKGNREFVAGLVQDPLFGPCVMFGLGGIFAEALRDVSFRVAPFDEEEALAMIGEIRAQSLLGPFRGGAPVDLSVLAGVLVALSRLACEQEAVKEVDINPLLVGFDGRPKAVDALAALD